jgi:hypothetical protein
LSFSVGSIFAVGWTGFYIPNEYYKNILEGAYNRKEKYVPKNKTRKNPKKNYL